VTGLTAQDALTPNVIAVGEDMRPRDVTIDPLCEVFAVFKELPSSLTPLHPPFVGLVERERIGGYPFRIFADLISNRNPFAVERSTPLAHVMSRFEHFSDTAMAVLGSPQQLIGVVTRRSALETLLEHERRQRSCEFDAQASPKTLAPKLLPIGETMPSQASQRTIQHLATEWVLSDNRERQHLAGEIQDRLRQFLVMARVHLSHAQKLSAPGHALGSLRVVDQLLEESITYSQVLIEELTPAALRTSGLVSALDMLAVELRQGGYQAHVPTSLVNLRVSEPITAFLYRAIRSFLRQARGEKVSSLITVSLEGEPAGIVRVRAAINGGARFPGVEEALLLGSSMAMNIPGIQALGTLLGIAISVESSPGTQSALVFDVPLLGSSTLL
jgi:hypothetical protein